MSPSWNSMALAYFHLIQHCRHVNTAPLHLRFGGGTPEITVSANDSLRHHRGTFLFLLLFEIKVLMSWWQSGRYRRKPKGPRFNSWMGRAFACFPRVCESFSCSDFPHNHLNVYQVNIRSLSSAKIHWWRSGSGPWQLQRGGKLLLTLCMWLIKYILF